MYIYPDNLTAKPTLFLWQLRDIAILAPALLLSIFLLVKASLMLPLILTIVFAMRGSPAGATSGEPSEPYSRTICFNTSWSSIRPRSAATGISFRRTGWAAGRRTASA